VRPFEKVIESPSHCVGVGRFAVKLDGYPGGYVDDPALVGVVVPLAVVVADALVCLPFTHTPIVA